MPPLLAEKILATRGRIEGERRQVTVMFCDLAGSTRIAEQIGAESYRELLDEYLAEALPCVHRYEGLVNQLAGDGFMAIFGAPIAHDNDAERAAHAALEIQAKMRLLAERWQGRLRAPLLARIGLHTGPVIVGTVGTDLHMEYSAVGDTTNVAARIEQNTTPGEVFISSATRKLIAQDFTTEEVGSAAFKGKSSPVDVFRLVRAVARSERRHQALRSGLSRFLGRHAELALVLERFDEVRTGAGQVVFIGGEAGIGKSRLAYELRQRVGEDDVLWLEGQCVSYGRQSAYLPIADMLRGLFGIDEADSAEVVIDKVHTFCAGAEEAIAKSEPFYRDLLAVDPGDASLARMDVTMKTGFYFESVRDLFHSLARRKPVLFLIEDLHWLDESSEQLLRRLFDTLTGARILVLATHRPDYRWRHAERDNYTQLSLRGLPAKLVGELTENVLGRIAIPDRLREAIALRSDGNPFFVEEVAKVIAEQGVVDPDAASRMQVPATVQEVIQARMDRLDERARRTLQIASVIGREFTLAGSRACRGARSQGPGSRLGAERSRAHLREARAARAGLHVQARAHPRRRLWHVAGA